MKVSNNDLYQNCINRSAPTNTRAARDPDKKYFKWHILLNHWCKIKIISQNFSSAWYPLPKLHKRFHSTVKGPPERQIRNNFKWHLFLNQQSKFKIISQNCSSWCLVPILVFSEYGHVVCQIKAAYNNISAYVLLLHLHSKGWFVFFSESSHVA